MPPLGRLEKEIERIGQSFNGVLGVSAVHIESGKTLEVNGTEAFPMASTYKVAIAVQLLKLVDNGTIALSDMIEISPRDLSPGGGIISAHFYHPGISLSVLNLLELMLTISDNTASDLCLELAGGPQGVNTCLAAAAIGDMRVDRSTKLLLADWLGIAAAEGSGEWSLPHFKSQESALTPQQLKISSELFLADGRDSSTPAAMVSLLLGIFRGTFLKEASTKLLLQVMGRCQSGKERLKGMLPVGSIVAHKTGTIPRVAINDVGILTLPQGAGHVAISVFTKSALNADAFAEAEESQAVIAQGARAVFDFFLFGH